jgi:hypothetical protein
MVHTIHRISKSLKESDAQHLELMREAIADSEKFLKEKPSPDAFAGRKTYEPFPPEGDDY